MEIVIKIKTDSGKVFEFSIDEAFELKEKLIKMLGEKKKVSSEPWMGNIR